MKATKKVTKNLKPQTLGSHAACVRRAGRATLAIFALPCLILLQLLAASPAVGYPLLSLLRDWWVKKYSAKKLIKKPLKRLKHFEIYWIFVQTNKATMKYLEIFLSNDQPTTCPKCGSRTEFFTLRNKRERHICLSINCKKSFLVEHEN